MIKIAINGFGRIGRNALKIALMRRDLEVVAINDLTDTKTLAFLLKHDSSYGTYSREVTFHDHNIIVTDPETAKAHLAAGARKGVISAPAKGEGAKTIVLGVNEGEVTKEDKILSNASCTTNCIAPIMKVLEDNFGVKKAMMTTVHSYTGSQRLLDAPAKDLREARSAAENIVPTTTGASKAAAVTIPSLKGKFNGLSVRVPTPVVSLADITAVLSRPTTKEELTQLFEKVAGEPFYEGILGVSHEELVSSDYRGDSHSCIVDLPLIDVVDGDLIKIVAWYDNEWGYSNRLVELTADFGKE